MDSREQSYYYQRAAAKKKTKWWGIPRWMNRMVHRNPRAIIWVTGGLAASVWLWPFFRSLYYYVRLSPEEFRRFQREERDLLAQRAAGKNLYNPFTNRTFDFYAAEDIELERRQREFGAKKYRKDVEKLEKFFGIPQRPPPVDVSEDD